MARTQFSPSGSLPWESLLGSEKHHWENIGWEFLVRMMTVNISRASHLVICYLQAKRAIKKMVKTPPHVHVTHACMAMFGMQSQRPCVSILLILRACLQKLIFQKNPVLKSFQFCNFSFFLSFRSSKFIFNKILCFFSASIFRKFP